jgi:hypothetical protein
MPPAVLQDVHELRRLLRLDPEAEEFKLVFGSAAADNKEVAVLTRSVMHVMQAMASHVDVPAKDLADGRAVPGWESASPSEGTLPLIQIRSSSGAPEDAFVSICYRDHWFWIDDRDLRSKRVFAFIMMLFTLADTSERDPLPLITIPAQ